MVTAVKASLFIYLLLIFSFCLFVFQCVYFQLDVSAEDFKRRLAYQMYKRHQQGIDSTEFPLRLLAQPVAKVMCELGLEAPQSFQSVSSLCQALLRLPLSHQNALQELFFPTKLHFVTNITALLSLAHNCLSPFVRCNCRCSLSLQRLRPSVVFLFHTSFLFPRVCSQWRNKSFKCQTVYLDISMTLT